MGAKNKSDRGRFIKLDLIVYESPAFQDLSDTARSLLLELCRRHNGSNNGQIGLSVREASKLLHRSDKTISLAFNDLMSHGLIRQTSKQDYLNGKAREWAITFYKRNGCAPRDDWNRWTPDKLDNGVSTTTPHPTAYDGTVPRTTTVTRFPNKQLEKINEL